MKNPTRFLTVFFLIILISNQLLGQTRYTDIVPDAYLETSQNFTIDINEDNIIDFEFRFEVTHEYDTYTYHYRVITSENSQVAIMEDEVSNGEDASVIEKGDTIYENLDWSNESEVLLYIVTQYYGEAGNWVDVNKGYLGLRIKVDTKYYYAWLRIHAYFHYFDMWIADFAIENTGNTQIIAGDGIPSGGTSVFAQDKNDYFDGRDIQVSFTRASDENEFSEYRIILAKAEDSTANNLEFMNQLPENLFSATIIDSSWINQTLSYSLLQDAVDKDGDSVMSFFDYKIHLLNVAKSGNPTDNILSTPSPPFYLQSFTQAAFKPIAQDIGNSNNSSDVEISFKPAEEEWNLREYRVFLGLKEDIPGFNVQNALILTEDYYTKYIPDELDINLSLNPDQKDISGNTIEEGNIYQAIVLSVADSMYSVTSALSPTSREFKLSNPNYIVAGQKSGNYLVSYPCDSLFSSHERWGSEGEEVNIDMNRDGVSDFVLSGLYQISPMFENIRYSLKPKRSNKVLDCNHSEHDNWIDVLNENGAIGPEFMWSKVASILVNATTDAWSGQNYWHGHLDSYSFFVGNSNYIGFYLTDNSESQYAWLRIDGTKFIEYAFQDFSSGVTEPKVEKEFVLYPNPAENKVFIQSKHLHNGSKQVTISVYNSLGMLIENLNLKNANSEIEISHYPSGLYYCVIRKDDNSFETHKLVVK